jgi:hypothetical protein
MRYGNKVKVIEGFYKGLTGLITSEETRHHKPTQYYYVEMSWVEGNNASSPCSWIREEYLKKVI